MKGAMITAEMIAPCGLDCSLCKRALAETNPCPGCHGPNEKKPEFCAERCGIILCRKRIDQGYQYCDEIWPSHGDLPLSPDCIRKHCNGARQILNKEIEGAEKELFGQKIKVYHVGETIFLYDT